MIIPRLIITIIILANESVNSNESRHRLNCKRSAYKLCGLTSIFLKNFTCFNLYVFLPISQSVHSFHAAVHDLMTISFIREPHIWLELKFVEFRSNS